MLHLTNDSSSEVINKGSLNLLRSMESIGLIHLKPHISRDTEETIPENKYSFRWMRGIYKGLPGASVDEFLAECRADKEREFAIEKREKEERAQYAKLSS